MGAAHVIVDYGMGNLHSVLGALRYLGIDPVVSGDPAEVATADSLVLPGVGSFYKAMGRLEDTGLADALREAVLGKGRKILGICLGQQLMADHSAEDGGRAGLGFFSGDVTRLPRQTGLKVPHVGFNKVRFDAQSRLFAGFDGPVDCYFVHSYRLGVEDRPGFAALCDYGGDFVAAYEHENVFCTQFHPEKSQTNGLRLLSNFLAE
ncbi:imidazole glycerol phosphate synthase subunit HisH [Kordiimonas sp.]|uniref:imidazole glycerol phosphate synthase subunit HisH n=1 Tax=Kordiimonas sp. TaxID=1970157 RepID=UPI003A8E057A